MPSHPGVLQRFLEEGIVDTAEFDRFADEYRSLHLANVIISAGPVFRSAPSAP